jgi:AAA+ superfamily predicted ATPase
VFSVRANSGIPRKGGPLSTQYRLQGDLQRLNVRLRVLLSSCRRTADDDSLKPFRGLVVSDEEAASLLEDLDQWLLRPDHYRQPTCDPDPDGAWDPQAANREGGSHLDRLCRILRLSLAERRCLVAVLAPEVDTRYERVFAYLQDDVTRKAPGLGLLLDLIEPQDPLAARRLFLPGSNLLRWQLLQLSNRPIGEPCTLLARGAHLDERIVEYLLDDGSSPCSESEDETTGPPPHNAKRWEAARRLLLEREEAGTNASRLFVLSGPAGAGQRNLAGWLAREVGLPLFWVDARTDLKEAGSTRRAVREALLNEAALAIDCAETSLTIEAMSESLVALAELAREHLPLTFIILSRRPWQPLPAAWARDCMVVELPLPDRAERLLLWQEALADLTETGNTLPTLAAQFPFTGEQIHIVADQFRHTVPLAADGRSAERLKQLCRAHLPTRVPGVIESDPQRTWDDLVLPSDIRAQLEELCGQARHRSTVLGQWGFDRKLSGGKGLHALFAGPSGTGKTLAAEVIASALGRALWRIDLSQTVSKYIGETEKNLDRVFRAADSIAAVLFFDEADALFGKRSEVKDAHDRFANQEISYLLQQMDEYEGVAILATNLSRNLDEAFVRRLQFIVEFPFPDEEQRLRIWQTVFPDTAPRAENVDLPALARSVRMSGGHIRNIALAAAFAAADGEGVISMEHLWHAARREYQKIGQEWTPPTQTAPRAKEA